MTSPSAVQLRSSVHTFIGALGVLVADQGNQPEGWSQRWIVRGDEVNGLVARVSDRDDVIEFGLLERTGDASRNVLQATLVLEDDQSELNCMSEAHEDLNFDAYVTPDERGALDLALRGFAEVISGSEV